MWYKCTLTTKSLTKKINGGKMKRIFILFLLIFLFVGILQAVLITTPDGRVVDYHFSDKTFPWNKMGENTNVDTLFSSNIELITFWPPEVRDSLCEKADDDYHPDYVWIQCHDFFDGMICGGLTSPHQEFFHQPIQVNLTNVLPRVVRAKFDYESFKDMNQSLYGMYMPAEDEYSVFEAYQCKDGNGGYKQCNNILIRHYFEKCPPKQLPIVKNVETKRDTVKCEPKIVYKTITIEAPCNPYWEHSGWVEVAGTWLYKGLQGTYNLNQFANFHTNFNEKNSYDELFYLEMKYGIPRSKFVGSVGGGFIDRLAKGRITAGYERACKKEKLETQLGLGYEFRQYSFYKRKFLNTYQTKWVDEEQRVIMYYPFIYGKVSIFFNDRNKNLRKHLEEMNITTKNLKKQYKDHITFYSDIGPNTESLGSQNIGIGKYSLGFFSKIQPKNLYSMSNIEYSLYPEQNVIFKYAGGDSIKTKGKETMTYIHLRFGPKLSENTALFAMGQYIKDRMNQTASELGDKSIYIRKDLGIGITWKKKGLEYLLIVSAVKVENIHDNYGWSCKFSINF